MWSRRLIIYLLQKASKKGQRRLTESNILINSIIIPIS